MKKIISLILFILILVAAAALVKNKKAKEAQIPVAKQYPIVVKTQVAQLTHQQLTFPYLAEVKSDQDVVLSTNIGGRIKYIAPVGQKVKIGDKIITIDSTQLFAKQQATQLKIDGLQAKKSAAISKLNSLKDIHARTQKLLAVQGASIEQSQKERDAIKTLHANIDGINAEIAGLKAELTSLKQQLTYANVVSPINGLVSKTLSNKGTIASPGKPLIQISALGGKYLLIKTADQSIVQTASFQGQICKLTPLNSTENGLNEFTCHANIHSATGSLVDIKMIAQQGKGIYLPINGLIQINKHAYVLKVKGNQAVQQPVTILATGVEGFAVKGLPIGTEYVVAKPDILLRLMSGQIIKTHPLK